MRQVQHQFYRMRPGRRAVAALSAASLGATTALLLPSAAAATSPPRIEHRRELGYFLPKTKVVATVAQQIMRCPTAAEPDPVIETRVSILDRNVADATAFVRIDARSGFLAKRTTKLTLRADGTLETFNSTTEGQGGAVLAAAIKTVAVVGAAAIGAPGAAAGIGALGAGRAPPPAPPPPLTCEAKIAALIGRRDAIVGSIALIDATVEKGAATPDQLALAARNREALTAIDADLTLIAQPIAFDPKRGGALAVQTIGPVDYKAWFGDSLTDALRQKLPGSAGFAAKLTPDAAMLGRLKDGDGSSLPAGATPYLIYRRPIPARVSVAPCRAGVPSCQVDEASDLAASKTVTIPQLSGLFSIRIGRGGLFGTREANARFDESGAPLELEYGSSRGGDQIAGVIDAGREGFTTLRDAELAALQRRKDLLTTRKEVDALEKELSADQPTPAAGGN